MASLPAEEKVEFLLQVLATGAFEPDYDALAKRMGINTRSNAQRRLKGIVEADKGFILKSAGSTTSVVETGKSGDTQGSPVARKKATPAKKGRKRAKSIAEVENDEESRTKTVKKDHQAHDEDEVEEHGAATVDSLGRHSSSEEVV